MFFYDYFLLLLDVVALSIIQQELKLELHDLKKKVKVLPELLAQEMEKTTKLTNQFGSMKMSNMEGKLNIPKSIQVLCPTQGLISSE